MYKPRNVKDCQQTLESRREVWNRFSLTEPQEEPTLPTFWFWTSSLQNGEAINFYCFSNNRFVVLYGDISRKLIHQYLKIGRFHIKV